MTHHKHFFDTFQSVFMDDNGMVEVVGKNFTLMKTHVKGCVRSIRVHEVFYMPKLHANL